MRKKSDREKFIAELRRHRDELGRSKAYRAAMGNLSELVDLLVKSASRERAGLEGVIGRILKVAEIIPLDASVIGLAGAAQIAFDISFQDSIVLASVFSHLGETKPTESCFLNQNTRDFDTPNVKGTLMDQHGCKLFGKFDYGLRYVKARLRDQER